MSLFKKTKNKEIEEKKKRENDDNISSEKTEKKGGTKLVNNTIDKENSRYFIFIDKPIISEKSTILGSLNKYSFKVPKFVNKKMVKEAIEQIYKVKVKDVNILNVKGKKIIYRGKIGRKPSKKKAVVTLEKGHSIEILPT